MTEGPDLFDEGEIAVGAQTTVRLAFDRQLLRQVVVKSLRPECKDDLSAHARLLEEAQITGQLEHPSIPAVYSIGERHGLPFFSMKKVAGVNLEQVMRHPEFDLGLEAHRARALDALLRSCDALAYAHHRGILHLDIKPSNVMVGAFGRVYLMDWGLALRLPRGRAQLQQGPEGSTPLRLRAVVPGPSTGEPRGTAAYASPEQARGEWAKVDERSDVYALGGTLYALLTGHGPHHAATPEAQWALAREGRVAPPQAAPGRTLPPGLVEIAMRALSPDPANRYASASAFQSALRNFWIEQGRFPLVSYPAGMTLLTEGQDAEAAYVIQKGRCRAERLVDGKPQALREMGPGDVFGELAVLDHGVRSATVVTLEPTVVVKMGRDVFDQALSEGLWLARFVRALSTRFRDVEDELLHVSRQHRKAELGRAALKAMLRGQPDWAPLRAALAAEWKLPADELDALLAGLADVRLGEDGRLTLR